MIYAMIMSVAESILFLVVEW